jgi:hypothetical protein
VIDTPGTNDFSLAQSDYSIEIDKQRHMNLLFSNPDEGLSTIVHCIKLDVDFKFDDQTVEKVANTLHSLTYTMPNYNLGDGIFNNVYGDPAGPRVFILFTHHSRHVEDSKNLSEESKANEKIMLTGKGDKNKKVEDKEYAVRGLIEEF